MLSAEELARTHTLFGSFMGRVATSYHTVGELLSIYGERSELIAGEDPADDLRVERFKREMASGSWTSEVVVRIGVFDGVVLVIDGIHRSIAYLACLQDGVSPEQLPPLQIDR